MVSTLFMEPSPQPQKEFFIRMNEKAVLPTKGLQLHCNQNSTLHQDILDQQASILTLSSARSNSLHIGILSVKCHVCPQFYSYMNVHMCTYVHAHIMCTGIEDMCAFARGVQKLTPSVLLDHTILLRQGLSLNLILTILAYISSGP